LSLVKEEGGFYDRDPRNYELKVGVVFPGPYKRAKIAASTVTAI